MDIKNISFLDKFQTSNHKNHSVIINGLNKQRELMHEIFKSMICIILVQ